MKILKFKGKMSFKNKLLITLAVIFVISSISIVITYNVNEKFKETIFNALATHIYNALKYENTPKKSEEASNLAINLIQIKTFLSLTSKEEAFDILNIYYKGERDNLKGNIINEKIKELVKNI